ncbi:MAG: RelA/SpoT domain-containing protein [Acidimicrobiales bacterium]
MTPIQGLAIRGPGFARIEGSGVTISAACPRCRGPLTLIDGTYALIGGAWRITPSASATEADRALAARLEQPVGRASDLSKSAVDRLGRRIAGLDAPQAGDEAAFRAWLTDYEEIRVRMSVAVTSSIGLPVAARLKTRATLVDKLTRDKLRLSQVQDVAGLRLTVHDRNEQDRVASVVASLFPESRTVDRRAEPSFGYRAVHIVGKVVGLPVEVQVRTQGQHEWAQLVERLADRWGRQIRYGHPPTDAAHEVDEVDGRSRADVMAYVLALASTLDTLERSSVEGDDIGDAAEPVRAAIRDLVNLLTDQ